MPVPGDTAAAGLPSGAGPAAGAEGSGQGPAESPLTSALLPHPARQRRARRNPPTLRGDPPGKPPALAAEGKRGARSGRVVAGLTSSPGSPNTSAEEAAMAERRALPAAVFTRRHRPAARPAHSPAQSPAGARPTSSRPPPPRLIGAEARATAHPGRWRRLPIGSRSAPRPETRAARAA